MHATGPHYLLYSEATQTACGAPRWKFVLHSVGGEERFSAADTELDASPSRLELLAVVRGLEAIDCPSRVTLLTSSRYVNRGIRRDLTQWRERRWRWERFGQLVPIRDHDLWQRIDRALQYHKVECCAWHVEDGPVVSAVHNLSPAAETASWKLQFSQWPAPRQPRYQSQPSPSGWSITAAFSRLRRGVLSSFMVFRRPTFTQAA